MKTPTLSSLGCSLLLALAALPGCERRTVVVVPQATPVAEPVAKTTTLETERLGHAVDVFDREPTAENKAAVEKALARLDEEIAELEGRAARVEGRDREETSAKLHNLQSYRASESLRFTGLRAKSAVVGSDSAPVDDRSGGEKVKEGAREVGGSIKDAAKDVGSALKDAVRR